MASEQRLSAGTIAEIRHRYEQWQLANDRDDDAARLDYLMELLGPLLPEILDAAGCEALAKQQVIATSQMAGTLRFALGAALAELKTAREHVERMVDNGHTICLAGKHCTCGVKQAKAWLEGEGR